MKIKTPKPSLSSSIVQKKIPTEKGKKKTNKKKEDNTQSGYNVSVYRLATFWLSCGSAPFSVCEPLWCTPS